MKFNKQTIIDLQTKINSKSSQPENTWKGYFYNESKGIARVS